MDIANRFGVKAHAQGPKGTRFVVTIAGLTDNATYGVCATRGTSLTAQASGFSGQVPAELSYQWYSLPGGAISGATQAAYTPDEPLADQSDIYCVVTTPDSSRSSAHVILREVAPQVQGSLSDEVFDRDTGPQIVAAAAAFAGAGLLFTVSGAGASIDAVTGAVSIPTDTEMDGAVVTVSASNSGGSETLAFQVTVEDLASVEGALPFGALTPAGAGGVPVSGSTITAGDPGGHWEIAGGMLVPTAAGAGALAGIYPLEFDTGDTLDVMIEPDKASARVEEIAAVFAGLPLAARGLLVQDGDARALGRLRLEPKVFLNEMVMEPSDWIEDADPRQSLRPVILSGLTIGGDPNDAEVLRMENLTLQGFVLQMEQGPGEPEANNGILLVERPSRHLTIRQNEIWSRTTEDIVAAGDYSENLITSRQMRGLSTSVYAGVNEHIRVDDNYIHDVSRGVVMTATNSYLGVRSRLCNNIIEHVYSNFTTCGYLNGLDIFDNKCVGVYAADEGTDGFVGQSGDGPHSATGGSFDAGGSRTSQNITMMGNLFHIGWKRTKLHADAGLPVPRIQATGCKFNDPEAPDSFYNVIVAFNTIVSHGLCLEMAGASADTYIEIFNNTLADESYNNAGSLPIIAFGGSSNVRLWNNIACSYYLTAEDGSGGLPVTLDTLEGYGNLQISGGSTNALGEVNYFIGDPVKGLDELTIDEALAAFVPIATSRALTADQKKGSLGTGLYAGNGVHTVVYDKPVPEGGVSHSYPLTTWLGEAHLAKGPAMDNLQPTTDGFTFAFKGRSDAAIDAATRYLFTMAQQRVSIRKAGSGSIYTRLETAAGNVIIEGYGHAQTLNSADDMVDYVVSVDLSKGVILFMENGILANWYTLNPVGAEPLDMAQNTNRVFAGVGSQAQDFWQGDLGLFYLHDEFVDLETVAGQSAFYAADGRFRDFGADGSGPTGTQPLIFVAGDAAAITATPNLGRGGIFTLSGNTITDANGALPSFGFDEANSTGTFSTALGHRIWQGADGDVLSFNSAGNIAVLEMRGAGGGGGHRAGGGGGAGELVQQTNVAVTAQTYTASVGVGGAGSLATTASAGSGGATRLIGATSDDIALSALGGGGGGSYSSSFKNGISGGSGGGAAGVSSASGGASIAVAGFGFGGGNSDSGSGGAGGGGAGGAAAGNVGNATGGASGTGRPTTVPGTSGLVCRGGNGGGTSGTNGANGTAYGDGGQGGSGTHPERNGGTGAAGRVYVAIPQ